MENLDELRDRAKKEKGSYYILMQFANPLDIAFEYGSEYGFEEPRKMQTEVSDIFVFEVDVENNYRMLYYEAGYEGSYSFYTIGVHSYRRCRGGSAEV